MNEKHLDIKDVDVMIEELSELIQALCKYKRYLNNDKTLRVDLAAIINNIKEEIVDVDIAMEKICDKIFMNYEDYDSIYMKKYNDYLQRLNK